MRLLILFLLLSHLSYSQTNIFVTTQEATEVLAGMHDPAAYAASTVIDDHDEIICDLQSAISTDSIHQYLLSLATFYNRNSGSDTASADTGMGAARRWALGRMQKFSADNEDRLQAAYLQFDQAICGMNQHKNVIGVLPGTDTANHQIIIIEGHMDSRCETGCDVNCLAEGMEDNGSGTALVLELARVMSQYTFKNTIVFMLTTAEEQGLLGANAFAQYCVDNNIPVKAVQNNDVVGGIYCGKTASPPTMCSQEGEVDSLNTRIFSNSNFTRPARGFARWANMTYQEKLYPVTQVPMTLHVMNQEDRTGRGGDHIPFSDRSWAAIRFTSYYEHGHGAPGLGYTDRQHTEDDILGVDTDLNGSIDSFFVDFNYLKRNTVINGASAAMLALGPETPDFNLTADGTGMHVTITGATQYNTYRVGVHDAASNEWDGDFDAVYRMDSTLTFTIPGLDANLNYWVSVASVDDNGLTSLFSVEEFKKAQVTSAPGTVDPLDLAISCWPSSVPIQQPAASLPIELLPPQPNPSRESTSLVVRVNQPGAATQGELIISDLLGHVVARIPIQLASVVNRVEYQHPIISTGLYHVSLVVDGRVVQSRKLIHTH
jgi:hypothetical protein